MVQAAGISVPAYEIRAVTKSDSTDLTGCRGFFITGSGNVAIKTQYGDSATTAVTITDCPTGVVFPIMLTRIMSTNTTATNIYALF